MKQLMGLLLIPLCALTAAACDGGSETRTAEVSGAASSASGGSVSLPDGTSLIVPPGALQEDVMIGLSREGRPPTVSPPFAIPVGEAVNVDIAGRTLEQPARLELPYDPGKMPSGATDDEVFAAYFDETTNEWVTMAASADPPRDVLVVETMHASWWQPWTWDLDAAINSAIAAIHLDLDEVTEPFGWYDGCSREPSQIRFETSGNDNHLGFCAERDDGRAPAIRLVNRRTFVIRVSPQASAVGSTLMAPQVIFNAERYSFDLDYSQSDGSSDFTVKAEVDVPFTLATLVADLVVAVPGVEKELGPSLVLGIYGCLSENAHLTRAMDALIENDVGLFKDEVALTISDAPSVECVSDLIVATVPKDKLLFKATKRVLKPLLTKFAAAAALYQISDGLYNLYLGPQVLLVSSEYAKPLCALGDPSRCGLVERIAAALMAGDHSSLIDLIDFSSVTCTAPSGDPLFDIAPLQALFASCLEAIPRLAAVCPHNLPPDKRGPECTIRTISVRMTLQGQSNSLFRHFTREQLERYVLPNAVVYGLLTRVSGDVVRSDPSTGFFVLLRSSPIPLPVEHAWPNMPREWAVWIDGNSLRVKAMYAFDLTGPNTWFGSVEVIPWSED